MSMLLAIPAQTEPRCLRNLIVYAFMYLRMYAAKPGVDVHRAAMIGRRCHENATDMQYRFTPFCDVLTTRSEC